MEVLVGPTFTIDVQSPSPPHPTAQAEQRLFLDGEEDVSGYRISGQPKFFAGGLSSESSSSIGTPDDSDNEEEVQSGLTGRPGVGSLDSLEDSLPIKRGLSSHFEGKSKSFTDLSQVSALKELQKQESPFNKRRRVLIASKWSRRSSSSFYAWSNPQSMPLLPVVEDRDHDYEDDHDHDHDEEEEEGGGKARKVPSASSSSSSSSSSSLGEEKKQEESIRVPESYAAQMRLRLRTFKTRSFSLADLQEHDEEEEEEQVEHD